VEKTSYFQAKCVHISKTVRDTLLHTRIAVARLPER